MRTELTRRLFTVQESERAPWRANSTTSSANASRPPAPPRRGDRPTGEPTAEDGVRIGEITGQMMASLRAELAQLRPPISTISACDRHSNGSFRMAHAAAPGSLQPDDPGRRRFCVRRPRPQPLPDRAGMRDQCDPSRGAEGGRPHDRGRDAIVLTAIDDGAARQDTGVDAVTASSAFANGSTPSAAPSRSRRPRPAWRRWRACRADPGDLPGSAGSPLWRRLVRAHPPGKKGRPR